MRFIKEINALNTHIIICFADDGFSRKLLNIYNCDRILAGVVGCANGTDILDKIILGIYLFYMEPAGSKFLSGLC